MSNGSSSKVAPWTTGGSVGQGDSSYRLGRPRKPTNGSPSMSADSTLSSKHATGKILDLPDDVETPPMFPDQDPSYMERLRNKPLPMQNRKGVPMKMTKQQLRKFIKEEFESDGFEIDDDQLNEFLGIIPRIAGTFGRTMVSNFADDAVSTLVGRFGGGPLHRALTKVFPSATARGIGKEMTTKAIMLGKEVFGDLPSAIEEGNEAIVNFDTYMATNPVGPGDAWDDRYYYDVENPLREAKLKILRNLVDLAERLAPGKGVGGLIKTSLKGTAVTIAADQFDAVRGILSVVGSVIPGDDVVDQAFATIEELDARIDSISSFTRPAGELDGGTTPGVVSLSPPGGAYSATPQTWSDSASLPSMPGLSGYGAPQAPLQEVKDLLRGLVSEVLDEYDMNDIAVNEDEDEDEEKNDDDVDEASGAAAVAGFVAPLHYNKQSGQRMKKMYSRHYKTVGPELKPKP